jgi:hypothetical protein
VSEDTAKVIRVALLALALAILLTCGVIVLLAWVLSLGTGLAFTACVSIVAVAWGLLAITGSNRLSR